MRLPSLFAVLAGLWPVLAHAASEAVVARQQFQPQTRFDRLVDGLTDAAAGEREEFARIAVEQMLREHDEALLALGESLPQSDRAARKRVTWGAATEQFLTTLDGVASRMASADVAIDVERSAAGEIYLYVDSRPVVLSALDLKHPDRLEKRIVDSFCAQFDCAHLDDVVPESNAIPRKVVPAVRSGWSFGDGRASTFRTRDGLHFAFADVSNRARKQQLCLQVSAELREVVELLSKAQAAGYQINWDVLRIDTHAQGSGDDQRLVIDGRGTFIRAPLPVLVQSPEMLAAGRAWLKARLDGLPYEQLFPSAERLFAQLAL